jgi:hypothetical protein
MTLAELIAQRRAAIAAFEEDLYGQAVHDISNLNEAIERTPITSKADALAALDLIVAETIQPGHQLVTSIVTELRRYLDDPTESGPGSGPATIR